MQQTLLIFAPFGTHQVHHQIDGVLGAYLRQRGFQTHAVLCDGLFPVCEVLGTTKNPAEHCSMCARSGLESFTNYGTENLQLRQFITSADMQEFEAWANSLNPESYSIAEYGGIPIGNWVSSSVCSYFRLTSREFAQPRVRKAHRQFLINGLLTHRAVTRIFEQINPSHCSIFNARMAPYRVAFELAQQRRIPTLVHERGWADNSFVTFENKIAVAIDPIDQCAKNWSEVPLNEEEYTWMHTYFANREVGKDVNMTAYVNYVTDYAKVMSHLRIPAGKRVLVACTTSEYELDFCDDFYTPIPQLDLIRELIEAFRERDEYLIIRHHPSLSGEANGPPDYSYLTRSFALSENLPENVRMVSSSEQLSSYSIFWHAIGCIAPFSMTGVEAMARGIPAIGFAQSSFRSALTSTFTTASREEIRAKVNQLLSSETPISIEQLRRLYRFQSSMIIHLCRRFKSFGIKELYMPDIKLNSPSDLQLGKDPELDQVARFFTHGESLQKLPLRSDLERDPSAETDFLQKELSRIADVRADVHRKSLAYAQTFTEKAITVINCGNSDSSALWQRTLARSRHKNINSLSSESSIPAVLKTLASVQSPYCVIRPAECCAYDEAFLSRAHDLLEASPIDQLQGVHFSLLTMDDFQVVNGVYFGLNKPFHNEHIAFEALQSKTSWFPLLSSLVLRTPVASGLLAHLATLPDDQQRFITLVAFILGPSIKHLNDALVFISRNGQAPHG